MVSYRQITRTLFNLKNFKYFHKISLIVYFFSIVWLLTIPYFTENVRIEEKNLRSSEYFANLVSQDKFIESTTIFVKEYEKSLINKEPVKEFIQKFFRDLDYTKDIYSISDSQLYIFSQSRFSEINGKFIMINFIYDEEKDSVQNRNLYFLYYLLEHFQNKDSYRWLSKGFRFSLIPRKLAYDQPKKLMDFYENSSEFLFKNFDFNVIFDLGSDISNLGKLYISTTGLNSEQVDLDYFAVISQNFYRFKEKLTTNLYGLSKKTKSILVPYINQLGKFFNDFSSFFLDFNSPPAYTYPFLDLVDFFVEHSFRINPQDINNILVSRGLNSVLVRTFPSSSQKNSDSLFTKSVYFIEAIERIIRVTSTIEIQNFRGCRFYFLVGFDRFYPISAFILILVCAVISIYFIIIERNNTVNFTQFNFGITILLYILSISSDYLVYLNISEISQISHFSEQEVFFYFTITSVLIKIVIFFNGNNSQLKFILALKGLWIGLFTFNIIFFNNGLGVICGVLFFGIEIISFYLDRTYLSKKKLPLFMLKFIPDLFAFYLIFTYFDYPLRLIQNFNQFNSSVYIFFIHYIIYFSQNLSIDIIMFLRTIQQVLSRKNKKIKKD